MDCSTPGLPVQHQLPEFTPAHVHQVGDAIQPSHPPSQSLPASVFSNKSTLHMRWPKYWSFSFSIIPSKEHPGLISIRMDWLDLLAVQGTLLYPPPYPPSISCFPLDSHEKLDRETKLMKHWAPEGLKNPSLIADHTRPVLFVEGGEV